MAWLKNFFGRYSDLALVIGVVMILLILFAPIPSVLLDLLIIVNFAFGLTILLLTFYVGRPVEFSTFPSLLLIATLFRLSLNVAATRLILSDADAGQVIGSIGAFAVQGNFVIGLVVFFILVVVQYVVVTNGAQRVSEVAARFVLDAMPGQQMSIDADLNMGLIDQEEAKRRRKELEKEAAFYGAMDGASKFVKGDAIAGIIILLINILGGWIIGVAQLNMNWGDALETFTLLTIGDGIVTQVPALIISVATGIIVTRSAADRQLSAEVLRQLVLFPKIQLIVMIALIGLLALPGMPKWPIVILVLLLAGAWVLSRRKKEEQTLAESQTEEANAQAAVNQSSAVGIEITFGKELGEAWKALQGVLGDRVVALRSQFATDIGLTIPPVAFKDGFRIGPWEYEISLLGDKYAKNTLYPDRMLAIRASQSGEALPGVETRDPAFGLPAVWIDSTHADRARSQGYTLVDPMTVLVTHLTELVKVHAANLLSRGEVAKLLDGLRQRQPGLVEELVPTVLALSDVQRVLQNLLAEGVSIRNVDQIVEILVDVGRNQKDPVILTEFVRQRIGYTICQNLKGQHDKLSVLTLEPMLESRISQSIKNSDGGSFVLEPHIAEQLVLRLMSMAESMMRQNMVPILLCAPDIRRHLKTFTRRSIPRLAVISAGEVPYTIDLKSFALVNLPNVGESAKAA